LTEKGIKQAQELAKKLKKSGEKFDLIISSDLERTRLTAGFLAKKLNLKIEIDSRLREWNFGTMDGETGKIIDDYILKSDFGRPFKEGESFKDIIKRINEFSSELAKKYQGKKVILVTHAAPVLAALNSFVKVSDFETLRIITGEKPLPRNCSTHRIFASNLERNFEDKIDIHKHFMDQIKLPCSKCKKQMSRVPEVLDCWFESGSMPYGERHFPF